MTKGFADAANFPKWVVVVRTESVDGKFAVKEPKQCIQKSNAYHGGVDGRLLGRGRSQSRHGIANREDAAPRLMKVGTTLSRWRYDAGTGHALQPASPRRAAIRYALAGNGSRASCRCAALGELGAAPPDLSAAMAPAIQPHAVVN